MDVTIGALAAVRRLSAANGRVAQQYEERLVGWVLRPSGVR
jgi:hypothetical protein